MIRLIFQFICMSGRGQVSEITQELVNVINDVNERHGRPAITATQLRRKIAQRRYDRKRRGKPELELNELVRIMSPGIDMDSVKIALTPKLTRLPEALSLLSCAQFVACWIEQSHIALERGEKPRDATVWTKYELRDGSGYHPGGYVRQKREGHGAWTFGTLLYTVAASKATVYAKNRFEGSFGFVGGHLEFNRKISEGILHHGVEDVTKAVFANDDFIQKVLKQGDEGLISLYDLGIDFKTGLTYRLGEPWPTRDDGTKRTPSMFLSDVEVINDDGFYILPKNMFTVFASNNWSPATQWWFMVMLGMNWAYEPLKYDMYINIVGAGGAGKGCLGAMIAAGFGGLECFVPLTQPSDDNRFGEAWRDMKRQGHLSLDENGITTDLTNQTLLTWSSAEPVTVGGRYQRSTMTVAMRVFPIVIGNAALKRPMAMEAQSMSGAVARRAAFFLCPTASPVQDQDFKRTMYTTQLGGSLLLAAECLQAWREAYQGKWRDMRRSAGGGSEQMRRMTEQYAFQPGQNPMLYDQNDRYFVASGMEQWNDAKDEGVPPIVAQVVAQAPEKFPMLSAWLQFFAGGVLRAPKAAQVVPRVPRPANTRAPPIARPPDRPSYPDVPTSFEELEAEAQLGDPMEE